MKQIILYQKENWDIPVKIFLENLEKNNPKLYTKTWLKIKLLLVDSLWNEDIKNIWDKIFELRIKQSSNISRIFYFTIKNEEIILLDWILKKSQKLDNSIIEKMKKFKNNYFKI